MQPIEPALDTLRELERFDLVALLEGATYEVVQEEDSGWGLSKTIIRLSASPQSADALAALSNADKKRVVQAIAAANQELRSGYLDSDSLVLQADDAITVSAKTELIAELIVQRGVMVDVATGRALINDVNDYYQARRRRIQRSLKAFELENPNQWDDLWEWYKYWREEGLSTYSDRRLFLYSLFRPVLEALVESPTTQPPAREPTGWERVDRALSKARNAMVGAKNEEDFQAIGLVCREVLISLGQAVYDRERHPPLDKTEPSKTDAKRMLEAFIAAELRGKDNENLRRYAKAALSVALELQHRRSANSQMALLCLEATSSTAQVITILSGRSQ